MSGICGILHFDGQPVEPGQVEAMTAFMAFRGPDGIDHWRADNVALGQCMLRTTPESLEEVQPLANEDQSLVLVMDGRVDNWEALRELLLRRQARLRTRADAELVLRAYEVWGEDCLKEIDGDFAFVIWDARQRKAFCARDRFGNKPFHYHWNGRTLAFATDLRPVLDLPWVPKEPDRDTLAEYLAADWITLDTTLWQGVRRLRAAHTMRCAAGAGLLLQCYWQPDLAATLPCKTEADHIEYYRGLFFDVVRRMCRSHRPLAMEVSGGLDSSAIFAVATTLLRQGRLPAPGLEGYTLDFAGVADADELQYADAVGAHLGVAIHHIPPARPPLEWYHATATRFADFPDFPNGAMGLSIAERAAALGSRTIFSGTGGDEWTGGSELYLADAVAAGDWAELARLVAADAREAGGWAALSALLRRGLMQQLPGSVLRPLRAARDRWQGTAPLEAPFWLSEESRRRLQALKGLHVPTWPTLGRRAQRRQLVLLDEPYWQAAKGMNDRRAALTGIEWRQPFWSRAVVEAAFATPDVQHARAGTNRWLHRRAMKDLLPAAVLHRPGKASFDSTFEHYWPELRARLQCHISREMENLVLRPGLLSLAERAFTPRVVGWDCGPPWIALCLSSVMHSTGPAFRGHLDGSAVTRCFA